MLPEATPPDSTVSVPRTIVPEATPLAETLCVALTAMVPPSAMPPAEIVCTPPLLTVPRLSVPPLKTSISAIPALTAVPPLSTVSVPPDRTATLLLVWLDETVSVCPEDTTVIAMRPPDEPSSLNDLLIVLTVLFERQPPLPVTE
jgi:hypothetical protein